jgi:hypothetical protein
MRCISAGAGARELLISAQTVLAQAPLGRVLPDLDECDKEPGWYQKRVVDPTTDRHPAQRQMARRRGGPCNWARTAPNAPPPPHLHLAAMASSSRGMDSLIHGLAVCMNWMEATDVRNADSS